MEKLEIKMTDDLQRFVDDRIGQMGCRSVADYLHQLIREDRERSCEKELQRALLSGLDSGVAGELDDAAWQRIEQTGSERIKNAADISEQ